MSDDSLDDELDERYAKQRAKPDEGGWKRTGARPNEVSREEMEAEARRYGRKALNVFVNILRSKTASQAAKMNAAQQLLERGFGRPMTPLEVTGKVSFASILSELGRDRAAAAKEVVGRVVDKPKSLPRASVREPDLSGGVAAQDMD